MSPPEEPQLRIRPGFRLRATTRCTFLPRLLRFIRWDSALVQDCQSHIDSNVSLAKLCSIYAWSKGSQTCYRREDAQWQFTAQPGGLQAADLQWSRDAPLLQHLIRIVLTSSSCSGPPHPPPPSLCTMTSHCASRLGGRLGRVQQQNAGSGVWRLWQVEAGWSITLAHWESSVSLIRGKQIQKLAAVAWVSVSRLERPAPPMVPCDRLNCGTLEDH